MRYDRPTLRRELESSGFEPLYLSYHFQWMYIVMLLMKWLGIQRGDEFQSPTRNSLTALAHRALRAITRLESRLLPGFLPGSSLVCVARRRTA